MGAFRVQFGWLGLEKPDHQNLLGTPFYPPSSTKTTKTTSSQPSKRKERPQLPSGEHEAAAPQQGAERSELPAPLRPRGRVQPLLLLVRRRVPPAGRLGVRMGAEVMRPQSCVCVCVFPNSCKLWVWGGPEVRFHQGSTRVPPEFDQGSTRFCKGCGVM